MKCPVCGRENGPDMSFCEGCGRKIPRCPTCGMEITCRDRFCSNDGTRLSDDLLLLVPEETVLQEPVWSVPAAPAEIVPEEPVPEEATMPSAPVLPDPWEEPVPEETVRVTAVSGGRANPVPPVSNTDPVSLPGWDMEEVPRQPPERAFCENCGKRIAPGKRYCSDCSRALNGKKKGRKNRRKEKTILMIILILLLLAGLCAGGYALVNSDLFDWDSNSSNQNNREDEEDEEEEEQTEDSTEDTDAPIVGPEDPVDPSQGVEDPVTTEPSTEDTQPVTDTTPPDLEEVTPLMYWIENCDKEYLTEEDLAGFDRQDCVYARNACYAKSGRMFNSTELQAYFAQFDWYHPTVSPNNFNDSMLNAYQVANINLILAYEREHGYN